MHYIEAKKVGLKDKYAVDSRIQEENSNENDSSFLTQNQNGKKNINVNNVDELDFTYDD